MVLGSVPVGLGPATVLGRIRARFRTVLGPVAVRLSRRGVLGTKMGTE